MQSSGWPLQAVVAEVARGEGTVEVRDREVVDRSGEGDGVGSSASRADGRCMLRNVECYVLVIAGSFSCVQNSETSSRNKAFIYEMAIDASIGAIREENNVTKDTKTVAITRSHYRRAQCRNDPFHDDHLSRTGGCSPKGRLKQEGIRCINMFLVSCSWLVIPSRLSEVA